MVKWIFKVYCNKLIRVPTLECIYPLQVENTTDLGLHETFDVFVSHSEVEYNFIKDKIVPFLDKHYRVCFPERNFVPGKLEYGQYKTSFENSHKWIVLLSAG